MQSLKRRKFLSKIKQATIASAFLGLSVNLAKGEDMQKHNVANDSKQAKRNASKNPFNLVYDGAISKNEKGKVQIQKVFYKIAHNKIAANLYTPPNFDDNKSYAAIVVAHPNGGVKEQVAGLYAQKLAELGFITLAFDAAYQGESEGLPRNVDKPSNRIEDIHSAIDFLGTFKGVDSDKLGVLGICGGGGYSIKAAQSDKRLKAVATLSLFDTPLARKNGFKDSEISSIQERLQKASLARSDEVKGKIAYTGFAPKKLSDEELAKIPHDLYKEGMVYYGDTHAHPNSTFAYTTSSLMQLMSFDISSNAELINTPFLMLVGDKADTAYMSEAIFKKASGTKQKELFRLTNATHIQTYFEPRIVSEAIKKLKAFYGEYL